MKKCLVLLQGYQGGGRGQEGVGRVTTQLQGPGLGLGLGQASRLCLLSHLLQTGAIRDLLIISERQVVKGMSQIIAVTGQEATRVCS